MARVQEANVKSEYSEAKAMPWRDVVSKENRNG
jgi:hypothetical protein